MSTMSTAPRTATSKAYDELIRRVRETHLIDSTGQLLGWDQEVFMPEGGVAYRSDQLALLARLAHESFTDPAVGDLIDECAADRTLTADPLAPTAVNIRELRRDFDRRTKLPAALVEEEARLSSLGQHVWREARAKSDFAVFRPTLEKIVDMVRRKAACYGWAKGGEPWDALAED
ncbi:MAG: hypothetical protein KDA25_05535, partial [Phycisphaerales bacterium]|nr:hypothetical protein [Phycisphaerales bacterium]